MRALMGMPAGLSPRRVLRRGLRTRARRIIRRLDDRARRTCFAQRIEDMDLPVALVHHASLLHRRLGETDPELQESKIINLRRAIPAFDGLLIEPGQTCSFWQRVGRPTAAQGYVPGLVLSHGEVSTGIGGGLCQLSNLLYWMALHTPLLVTERHHHSFDPFPDDRRVLPFGSGATVVWDLVDLRLFNPTEQPLQLRVRLTAEHLEGAVHTDRPWPVAYHVIEREHRFIVDGEQVFRQNELHRRLVDRHTGRLVAEELVALNRARVTYTSPIEGVISTT